MSAAADAAKDLAAALDTRSPLIDFVGKRSGGRALLAERDAVKRGLGALGVAPGARLLVFLPNCPAVVSGLLAGLELGLDVGLADPRGSQEVLRRQLEAYRPDFVLTADLAIALDRLLQIESTASHSQVLVLRTAAMLPFPRNVLTPLLRGSGLARVPELENFHDLRGIKGEAAGAETVPSTHLHLPEGSLSLATLLAMARGRRLPHRWILGAPLAKSEALILLLASLRQGKLATLTPRLDRGSLEKLAKKNGAEVLPTAPSSETEASASSAGSG